MRHLTNKKYSDSSSFNKSFTCVLCDKKHHLDKMSKSEQGVCIECHLPDAFEDVMSNDHLHRDIKYAYSKHQMETLFNSLSKVIELKPYERTFIRGNYRCVIKRDGIL